jgi:hypothetical protein
MNRAARVLALVSLGLATAPGVAGANGDTAHAWITEHAIDHLPDGQLRRLLERPELREILINGSIFPDGGYVVDDDYGEIAHWEPFLTAYIDWIQDRYDTPLVTGVAAEHAVFLLGVASHGLADQTFDSAFGPAARIHDAAGWSDDLLQDHDSSTDLILVGQTGRRYDGLTPWLPADDLAALYRDRMGYTVDPYRLSEAQDLLHRLTLNYAALADERTVMKAIERYPWSGANLLDDTEPGAPPCQAAIVADYWLAVWDRLHGVSTAQNFVIATTPRSGAAGQPVDRDLVESQLTIVFGHGVETARFTGMVEVRDDSGAVHAVELASPWNVDVTNVLRIRPVASWAPDRDYTVTVAAPLESIDGLALAEPFTFTFSTRAAEPSKPSSDPTPHTGEPDVGEVPEPAPPAEDEGGGCAAGGSAGPLTALLAALIARRSRRGRAA